MTILYGFLGVVGLFLAVAIGVFNRLVTLRNRFKNAFSQIDVQLKRRYDLIPNLVETAKGYLKHERGTLEAVIAARNQAVKSAAGASPNSPDGLKQLLAAEAGLKGAMGSFMAVMESYPTLKGDQTMSRLMEELASTENRIAFARQAYNDSVMTYNTSAEVFPNNVIAGAFNFGVAPQFEIPAPEQREALKVSFG